MNGEHAEFISRNRETWDRWTDVNYESDFYDVAGFIAGRRPYFDPIELAGVGDVAGKRLLHLQCHFGMDTISWARLGAIATGVDFSPRAIERARELAQETGVQAEFVCCDVADARDHLDGEFDIVFVSYGAISWLPDLRPWARTIASVLAPGGRLFVVDNHPALWVYDDTDAGTQAGPDDLRLKYPYFGREPIRDEMTGNYADPDSDVSTVSYSWQHTFEEIIGSLLDAGMRITALREYDRIAWAWFPWMVRDDDGLWRMPPDSVDIPLMFSVSAVKDR